jgi:hypothetical protein
MFTSRALQLFLKAGTMSFSKPQRFRFSGEMLVDVADYDFLDELLPRLTN